MTLTPDELDFVAQAMTFIWAVSFSALAFAAAYVILDLVIQVHDVWFGG